MLYQGMASSLLISRPLLKRWSWEARLILLIQSAAVIFLAGCSSLAATPPIHPTQSGELWLTATPAGTEFSPIAPRVTQAQDGRIAATGSPESGRLPLREVVWRCPRMEPLADSEFLSRAGGTLVLLRFGREQEPDQLFLHSTSSGQSTPLTQVPEPFGVEGASRSRTWLLYVHVPRQGGEYDYGQGIYVVLDAAGLVKAMFDEKQEWLDIGWLSDTELVAPLLSLTGEVEIINPFTDERRTLRPELPGLYRPERVHVGYWMARYAPSLTRVAYPRGEGIGQTVVLRDVERGQDLWTWDNFSAASQIPPAWSPDGQTLAVAGLSSDHTRLEVYLVDLNGRATKWVDLADFWAGPPASPIWSPDGRYLTFRFLEDRPLLILDTQLATLTAYCIPVNGGPLWSPSGTHLIVPRRGKATWYAILEVETGRATTIGLGLHEVYTDDRTWPVAWLRDQ